MPHFRKKPVVIEAWKWNGSRGQRGVCTCEVNSVPHVHTAHKNSLGGFQHVFLSIGDWIIPEPDGEHFYPVKSDIFAATYDPVVSPQETDRG